MADNTSSDSATIKKLQDKLQADTQALLDFQTQFDGAQKDFDKAQTDLNNLNTQYAWPLKAFTILHDAGKWNAKDPQGHYWSVDGNGTIYSSATSTAQFQTYQQQWNDYNTKLVPLQTAVNNAKTIMNNLSSPDGTTGAIPTANQHVTDDLHNIQNFVPTTTKGQEDHAQSVQAAVQIASSNAATSQANAVTSESNAKIAATAGTTTTQIVLYIVGGIIVLGLIGFGIWKATKKKA